MDVESLDLLGPSKQHHALHQRQADSICLMCVAKVCCLSIVTLKCFTKIYVVNISKCLGFATCVLVQNC